MKQCFTAVLMMLGVSVLYSTLQAQVNLQRPVDKVSWEDRVRFVNALSTAVGLQPAYNDDDNDASLIEGANGFRYPLEAV